MMKTKVNITNLRILEIEKLRKIKKNDLDKTVKKLKINLIEDILKNYTTLLEGFLENPK
jgi:ferredoxin-fold anticodon binding domain-containing protein